jgi:hypothetical protein
MVKRWQFVSNQGEDGVGKDEKTRKIVRKTAMKAFRRNQRLERAKRFMQEGREGVDQCDLETTGEAAEDSCSEVLPQGLEQSGSLVLRQNQNGVEVSVHAYNAGALLQQMALNEYPVAASFPWPREIVSLDPFGSSPLGTCRTWHHLFTHCEYKASAPFFVNNDCSHLEFKLSM